MPAKKKEEYQKLIFLRSHFANNDGSKTFYDKGY